MLPRAMFLTLMVSLPLGCDEKAPAAPPPAGGAVAAPAAAHDAGKAPAIRAPTVARPGYVAGWVARPDGTPIGIKDIKYAMRIPAIVGKGEAAFYEPQPGPDGTWSFEAPRGIFSFSVCTVSIPFDGDLFKYNLYPTNDHGDTHSDKGVVGDFVWRIRGPLKQYEGKPNPSNHVHWYGASPSLRWKSYYTVGDKHIQHKVDDKTRFVFTAKPLGKLIDGSEVQPLTWTVAYDPPVKGMLPYLLNDIPPAVGGWRVSAKELSPDGTERPLLIRLNPSKDKPQAEVDLKIEADSYGRPHVRLSLECSRPTP